MISVSLQARREFGEAAPGRGVASADLHLGVGEESIFRDFKIERGWPLTDTSRRIVDRAMARAEPALIFAFVTERDAAKMGADADDDEPFRLFDALGVGLRIAKLAHRRVNCVINLFLRPMTHENRLTAPFDGEDLTLLDRTEVDLRRS